MLSTYTIRWPDISQHRLTLMGFSIVMIVCYHALCWIFNPIGEFNLGYAGVDVFFLLSGYGLRSSFERNSLVVFYSHRFKRIYPVYFVTVLTTYFIINGDWTLQNLVENLTTIGFYSEHGYNRIDWYAESLFTFYLLFPLIYNLRRFEWGGLIFLYVISGIFLIFHDVEWWYNCALSRLPIFFFGTIYDLIAKQNKVTCFWFMIISMLLYFPTFIFSSKFLAASFLVIPMIIIMEKIECSLTRNQLILVHFLGKYSFEIYLANLLLMYTYIELSPSRVWAAVLFVPIQFVYSFIMVQIRKFFIEILG